MGCIKMHISKKQKLHIVLSWTAVVIWMIVIFMLSAQQGTESSHLSDRVAEIVIEKVKVLIPQNADTGTATSFVWTLKLFLRKSAHFAEYFILGVLVMNAMKAGEMPDLRAFILALLFCVLYAASDELHQYFVPGRDARATDVLIDSIGALAGIGIPLSKRGNRHLM